MNTKNIRELFHIIGGNPAPKNDNDFSDEGLPFIRMKDLGRSHFSNNLVDIEGRINVETADRLKLKIIKKGSILMPRSGSVSLNHRAILGTDAYMVSHICALEVKNKNEINKDYAYYYFRTITMERITKKTTGLDAITFEDLGKIQIPLPPLEDQIRIAAVLGRAERLIAARKASIKALDELVKSSFLEMFGDPVRNEKGWEKINFERVVKDFRNGQSPDTTGKINAKVFTLSVISGNGFKGDEYKISTFKSINENSFVKNNDFLVCRGNGNIKFVGRSVIAKNVSENIVFPDTIICANIDTSKINKVFQEEMWKLPFIRNQIEQFARTTNGTYKINQQSLKEVIIIAPPLPLQSQFAAIVEKVETLKARYTASLAELENLYGSLSQRAFKGVLDLSRVLGEVPAAGEGDKP